MVGKKKYRRQQFQNAEKYKKQTETGTRVRMAYWNANGIANNPGKKQRIVEAMEEEQLDLVFISETHLRVGNQDDLSMFRGYQITTRERNQEDKGGGLLAVVNPNLFFNTFIFKNH